MRAARWAGQSGTPGEVMPNLSPTFMALAMAKVSKSAHEAIDLGFGNASDTIRFNARELLFVALKEARLLADVGYVPPVPARGIPVAGRTGIATLEMNLVNMIEGGMISAHDYRVSRAVAVALCGGEVEYGSLVDEDALHEALSRQWIAGAAEDVFSVEPPAANEKLLRLDNFILSPHVASLTKDAELTSIHMATDNLLALLQA